MLPSLSSAARPHLVDRVELSRPYYDAARDRSDERDYYKRLGRPDKLAPGAFFLKLSKLLKTTHTRELAYEPGKYLYDWVDLRPSLRLDCIYTDQPVAPGDPVRSLEEQAQQWSDVLASGPTDALAIARKIAALETREAFNCEHAVPRVWFDDEAPMRGDLHILFTCDAELNAFRSASKYFEFPDDGNLSDGNRFEPAGGKGPVARAVLYFLVRYPGQAGRYTEADLETLLRWHRQHPPDLYEQHRNQAIFAMQGNRNPFIDHPEWADRVAFRLGL